MAQLELLCGPAGSGKTFQCIEEFKTELLSSCGGLTNPSWFILPTTEHAERINDVILKDERLGGFFNLQVTTINAFIQKWMSFVAKPLISDLVKWSIVSQILKEQKFQYWNTNTNEETLVALFSDFLSEVKTQGISVEDFRKVTAAAKSDSLSALKFQDLLTLYEKYEARLNQMNVIDFDDQIAFFIRQIQEKTIIPTQLNHVWLDGFYDFSPAQLSFLKILKSFTRHITVTLTLDSESKRTSLFQAPLETKRMLEALGFQVKTLKNENNHRTQDPALNTIEQKIFSHQAPISLSAPTVSIVEATGENGEVERIARQILELYGSKNYAWTDFCVIFRHIGHYETSLRSVFKEFQIPVEIHERRKLKNTSFAQSFMSLTRLFIRNWKREDVVALLKFPSWRISQEEVFELERASQQRGIFEGKNNWLTFFKSFTLSGPLKDVIRILNEWDEKFKSPKRVWELNLQMKELIRTARIFSDFTRRTDDVGRQEAHAFNRFLSILEEIQINFESTPDKLLSFENYMALVLEGVSTALFSVRHSDRNRVQVYDVSTARQKEYKVVFLAGLLEGIFPRQIREDAVLKDDERRFLNAELKSCELRERLNRTHVERYLFYLAVTRAREKLILTTPRFDSEGHEALVSFYINEVKKIFSTSLPVVQDRLSQGCVSFDQIRQKKELYAWILVQLFQAKDAQMPIVALSLYNLVFQDPLFKDILESIFHQKEEAQILDDRIKERLKQTSETFSPTGLESFSVCPFRYFIQKTCQLEEKREPTDVMALGSVLHEALEHFYIETTAQKSKEDWLQFLETEEARQKLAGLVQKALEKEQFSSEKMYRKNLVRESLTEMLIQFLRKEKETEKKRLTFPQYFELSFGSMPGKTKAQGLPALKIENPKGDPILIRGTIDRVDVDFEKNTALVIDYKRTKSFDVEELKEGLHLQLPLYLLVIKELLNMEVAGAELYSLKKGQRSGFYVKELKEKLGKISGLKGHLSQEEFDAVLEQTKTFVREAARRIREGDIRIDSKNCDYCACDHICRFEKWKLVYKKRAPEHQVTKVTLQ